MRAHWRWPRPRCRSHARSLSAFACLAPRAPGGAPSEPVRADPGVSEPRFFLRMLGARRLGRGRDVICCGSGRGPGRDVTFCWGPRQRRSWAATLEGTVPGFQAGPPEGDFLCRPPPEEAPRPEYLAKDSDPGTAGEIDWPQ
ncbi:uncharacterized protein LOC144454446 [Phascolarctos cinereus]